MPATARITPKSARAFPKSAITKSNPAALDRLFYSRLTNILRLAYGLRCGHRSASPAVTLLCKVLDITKLHRYSVPDHGAPATAHPPPATFPSITTRRRGRRPAFHPPDDGALGRVYCRFRMGPGRRRANRS